MKISDCTMQIDLPEANGLFVTATDTEVGKTMVAGAIAQCLHDQGRRVGVFKPAASGCRVGAEGDLISEDAEFLAACAGMESADSVVPLTFVEPLAPNVAAARAGQTVDIEQIARAYRGAVEASDCVVVEGVGGLLCPLADDFWVIHLAQACRLPLVIVARPGLGTINHTLLTVAAARQVGLTVAGVVINRYPVGTADAATRSNAEQIAARGEVDVLAVIPDDSESSVERGVVGSRVRDAVAKVEWVKFT